MANFALVIDGKVHNVYRDVASADDFPAIADRLVECPPDVGVNWSYDGSSFVDPVSLLPPPTTRQKRRAEYFAALKVEPLDDQITVLGDQVDKILAQLETIRVATGVARTAEFDALLETVKAIKLKHPKPPPAG